MPHMVSFATGALLGAALLGAAAARDHGRRACSACTTSASRCSPASCCSSCSRSSCSGGTATEDYETHEADTTHHRHQASGVIVLAGDAVHNALDGVLIAAAFLTDFHLGVVTALAIMAHEIPQEVGNFAVLLHAGMSRGAPSPGT
jgi:zinc and cadmium transporter